MPEMVKFMSKDDGTMKNSIKTNLYRSFCSPSLYVCMLGIALLHYCNNLSEMFSEGANTLTDITFNMDYGFTFINWVLCIIGGGLDYCREVKNGYLHYNLVRSGVREYSLSKILSAALSGFFCIFCGLGLNSILSVLTSTIRKGDFLRTITETPGQETAVILEHIQTLFGMSCLGGLLSMVGLVIITIVSDYFMGIAMPVLILYVSSGISTRLGIPFYLKISTIYCAPAFFKNPVQYFLYVFIFTCLLGYFLYSFMAWKIERRMEHG